MSTITIGSVNCRGLSETVKRIDIFTKYKDLYDIIILVDTHSTSEKEKQWLHEWGYVGKFSSFSSKSRGVAVLFRNTFEFKIHGETIDLSGNFVILDITIQDYRITLAAIYGPNNDEPAFFDNIKNKISHFGNSSIVVVGDWNVVQDYEMDTLYYRNENNPQSKAKIHEVMHDLDLLDIWRLQHPFEKRYSWRGPNRKQSRLDYFMITSDIEAFIKKLIENNLPSVQQEREGLELELKVIREKNVKGIITRAKARWQVEGEKGSNYFCNLEKKHYTEKIIPKLILEDESEIMDPCIIRNEQKQFYKKLYTSSNPLLLEIHRSTFLSA
ncbi:E3.1.11.2 [Mytilus edulis]|uniref:exodeoxyribonuclease III n=1 Tax=Mytilus edulis TaxID=6550 RepID=A0A8S3S5B5_MYTED|nr:E3.1.11.2 [Mytilus edulis]